MTDAAPISTRSRYRTALRRWSIAAIALGTLGVIASEVAGGVWPITFVTPLARQLAAMILLGVIGLLILRSTRREQKTVIGRPTLALRTAVGIIAIYATLVAVGLIPWRDIPTLQRAASNDTTLGQLKILSANVHSSNLDRESLLKLIATERPDVIVLMELNAPWIHALKTIHTDYPVRQVVADDFGNFGIGVWSKLPGEAKLVVRQHGAEPSLLDVAHAEMTLDLNGQPIRIFGVHPLPPLTPAMLGARDALLRSIADEIAKDEAPTILAGDLNATRYCRITRDICAKAKLADTMPGVGTSWPMTLARPVLGIRIDHILSDDAWRLVENHAGPPIGSDHLPMVATLQLTKGTG